MAPKELKDKISKVIDNMPDDILEDVFNYLKAMTSKSRSDIILSQNLGKIIEEDKNLLEKLAK
jgi:hypothetical protein